jgi:hypothetical protein
VLAVLAVGLTVGLLATACKPYPFPGPTTQGENVAVLVVDDFGLGPRTGDPAQLTADNDCPVATNDVGSGGAGDGPPPPPYHHGELVYSVLKEELSNPVHNLASTGRTQFLPAVASSPSPAATGGPTPAPHSVETGTSWTRPGTSGIVRLQAVNIDHYTTYDTIKEVLSAISNLENGNDPDHASFTRFVLNLSFVDIPCDVRRWLAHGDADLLSAYQALVTDPTLLASLAWQGYYDPKSGMFNQTKIAPNGGSVSAAVFTNPNLSGLLSATAFAFYSVVASGQQKARDQVSQDPAQNLLEDLPPGPEGTRPIIIPVGAAGNGAWYRPPLMYSHPLVRKVVDFPFAPALWPMVVSVSANKDGVAGTLAAYSNWGEVREDGTGPAIAPGSHGTSFAAPRVSAEEAMYLFNGGLSPCGHSSPALKYADPDKGPWNNLDPSAWDGVCSGFTGIEGR